MKNWKSIAAAMLLLLTAVVNLWASQRMVVVEHFTQWNCSPCVAPNALLEDIYSKYNQDMVLIRYHAWWPNTNDDPFYLANPVENAARIGYYGTNWVPWDVVDGQSGTTEVDTARIVSALANPSPVDLSMVMDYDTLTRNGTITWTAKATDNILYSNLWLHTVITESNVRNSGGDNGEKVFNQAMRDMVGDQYGDTLTLVAAGDSVTRSKSFYIDPSWDADACEIVQFLQGDTNSTDLPNVLQGSKITFSPKLIQQRYTLSEIGDGDGFYEPNESGEIAIWVKNIMKSGTGAKVTVTTNDPYVTIDNGFWNIGNMNLNDSANNATVPFTFQISDSATMPEGHTVEIYVNQEIYSSLLQHFVLTVDTVAFTVGSPVLIYSEDFESGLGNWLAGYTAWATGIDWDTTQSDYHSANTCIVNAEFGNYANKQNRWIRMLNALDLRNYTAAKLTWYEKYDVAAGDKCQPELSTDSLSTTWSSTFIPSYSGTVGAWQQRSVDITSYCNNKKFFRLRFRLQTDTINVAKGWYVDDIAIEGYMKTGVEGRPSEPAVPLSAKLFNCAPNPFRDKVAISYQLSSRQQVKLAVYDITGRLTKTLVNGNQTPGIYKLQWDGRDEKGQEAANGVYFYSLQAGDRTLTKKLVLVK
jgi:hypothetical protein